MSRQRVEILAGHTPCPVAALLVFERCCLRSIVLSPSEGLSFEIQGEAPDLAPIAKWFKEYSEGLHQPFPYPLKTDLGPFSQRVLDGLLKIPFGAVMTYGKLASQLGNPRAARAVGNACNRNPFPLVIPCHRLVRSSGQVGGFAYGSEMKAGLLAFEGAAVQRNKGTSFS